MERFSKRSTEWAGSSLAFAAAIGVIVIWLVSGPVFGFSDTWQLVINTGTTAVTFLMVFLIQRAQKKESKVIELKLSEIVAALKGASNRLIDVERLSEEEIETLRRHYRELARLAAEEGDLGTSHSIEEAERRHAEKGASR
jgi:low affinity Fe/Cu permease